MHYGYHLSSIVSHHALRWHFARSWPSHCQHCVWVITDGTARQCNLHWFQLWASFQVFGNSVRPTSVCIFSTIIELTKNNTSFSGRLISGSACLVLSDRIQQVMERLQYRLDPLALSSRSNLVPN